MKSRLELELCCVQEVLSKLRPITAYCKSLEVEATEQLCHLLRMEAKLHPRLWARIVDIRAYQPTFAAQRVRDRIPSALMMDSIGSWEDLEGDVPPPDTMTSEALATPARLPYRARFHRGPHMHVLFDGGSQGGTGTAGYVIIGCDGIEIERVGVHLQEGMTNNEAEATALHLALKRVAELEDSHHP